MKAFQCTNCKNPIYFDNTLCENCNWSIGYLPSKNQMVAQNPSAIKKLKHCSNYQYGVCNWYVDEGDASSFCNACKLNRTIPNVANPISLSGWSLLELAKHRLVYQLHQLNLPVKSKLKYPDTGLCFDFFSNEYVSEPSNKKMTGHANGLVTIVLSEADSVQREIIRKQLDEPYRTIIGHFRHEVGHYYWERIILSGKKNLKRFRKIFGDERASYAEALKVHYKNGAPSNWDNLYISKYAAAHPWEDWAETWAHYLHLMDTLETAFYAKIRFDEDDMNLSKPIFDPYQEKDFNVIVDTCIPLYLALNSLNRSMGIKDIYPFVLNDSVVKKLNYIHDTINTFTNHDYK